MSIDYASLHVHSENSVLDGFSSVDEYLMRGKEIGLRGIGLTDHGNLHGVYSFLKKVKDYDMLGLPGCEFYVAPINPNGAKHKEPVFYNPTGKKVKNDVSSNGAYLHLTVWAYNLDGLHNLFRLASLSNDPERYYSAPRIDFDLLVEHSEGLIVSTGCPSSEISTRFMLGQDDKAYEYAGRLLDVFGRDRLFVEIMDHNMKIDLERDLLPKQMKLAKKMNLGLLATNDSHYAFPQDAKFHEIMLAKQSGSKLSDKTYDEGGKRFAFSGDGYYLKSGEEMSEIFPEEDFPGALSNSVKILEMAGDLTISYDPHLKAKPHIPDGMTNFEFYKKLINQGFKEKYGNASKEVKEKARELNRKELEVIHSSGFIDYMLVVREYIMWTKENFSTRDKDGTILAESVGAGRGSVGGSIHAYELGISGVDPVRYGTIFERFLSSGRGATYKITYEDGSTEEIIASDRKKVIKDGSSEDLYIHELEIGDEVD